MIESPYKIWFQWNKRPRGSANCLGRFSTVNGPSRTTSRAGCDETAQASAPWARQKSKNWLEKVTLVSVV